MGFLAKLKIVQKFVVGPGEIFRVARFCRVGMCAANISNLVLDLSLGLCHYIQTVRGKGTTLKLKVLVGVVF